MGLRMCLAENQRSSPPHPDPLPRLVPGEREASPAYRRRGAVGLAVAAALLLPRPAAAGACCMSATSFGVGRLLPWEDWAAGVQLGHARSLGEWDGTGALRWNPPDYSDGLSRVEPWAIVRVHRRVELHARLPVLVNDRRSAGESQTAGGLGDAGAGARVQVLAPGAYAGLPSLALTVAAVLPTGRRADETRPPLFAGTTGRGAWGGSAAIEAEYSFFPWFVRLDAGVTEWLAFRRPDLGARERYGRIGSAALSAGRELLGGALVVALAATGEWEAPLSLDGVRVPSSGARSTTVAGSISWRVEPRWTVVGTVENTVWPDGAAVNRDARVGFTLGIRRGQP
jgi:hypothetical protein